MRIFLRKIARQHFVQRQRIAIPKLIILVTVFVEMTLLILNLTIADTFYVLFLTYQEEYSQILNWSLKEKHALLLIIP